MFLVEGGLMMSTIGDRLRNARERKNLKQTQVMQKTGINNKTLSGYENGVSEPDLESLRILADLYEVTTDYLTGKTNKPTQILSDDTRQLINDLDLSDDQLMNKYKLKFKGKELDPESIRKILSFARFVAEENKED